MITFVEKQKCAGEAMANVFGAAIGRDRPNV
jgi:hypothetical protein